MASAQTEHRYFIHAPERVVAVVTRGGKEPGTLYLHTDHLRSRSFFRPACERQPSGGWPVSPFPWLLRH